MNRGIRVRTAILRCLGFSLLLLSACNSAPMRTQNWPLLLERHLEGVWTSDKFGSLTITCSGYIHLDDRGGFDLSNTGLKNAKIVELGEKAIKVETMPLIHSDYPMARYPYAEGVLWRMNFWNHEWKKIEERDCSTR